MIKRKITTTNSPADRSSVAPSLLNLASLSHVSYFTAEDLFPHDGKSVDQQQPKFCDFLWLFYLPSVKTIIATAVEQSLPLSWPEQPPTVSSLTTLHLIQSHVDEESLATIFGSLPVLETFEYHFACDVGRCQLQRTAYLDCTRLGYALQWLKKSLKTLIITLELVVRDLWQPDFYYWSSTMGDLRRLDEFLKLTRLQTPFAVLAGSRPHPSIRLIDLLPPN